MNLREKVTEAVSDTAYVEVVAKGWETFVGQLNNADEIADAAIATVFEALLSDTAVEAGARAIHSTERLMAGEWSIEDIGEHQLLNGPRTLDEDERRGYRYVATRSLKAAMSALTADAAQMGGELDD